MLKIALLGNHVVVNIQYICSDVRYVCGGQLTNPEKQYLHVFDQFSPTIINIEVM